MLEPCSYQARSVLWNPQLGGDKVRSRSFLRARGVAVAMPLALLLAGMPAVTAYSARVTAMPAQDDAAFIGIWKGESLCQVKDSPCNDEKVVYTIARAKESAKVNIRADKIVDGRPVTMGVGDWDYDKEKNTLTLVIPRGVWKLTINGNKIAGILTLSDKTIYRRMWLKKDDNQ
jgi:hypothetical protein